MILESFGHLEFISVCCSDKLSRRFEFLVFFFWRKVVAFGCFGQWWEAESVFGVCTKMRNWEKVRVWWLESMWIACDAAADGEWWFSGGKLGRRGTPSGDWIEFAQRNILISVSMKAPPNGFLAGSGEGVVVLKPFYWFNFIPFSCFLIKFPELSRLMCLLAFKCWSFMELWAILDLCGGICFSYSFSPGFGFRKQWEKEILKNFFLSFSPQTSFQVTAKGFFLFFFWVL